MFILLFLVLLTQFFTFWIFEPLTFFLEHVLEIRLLPVMSLIGFILIFSLKNIEKIK